MPENWAAFDVFRLAQTQWRTGFQGRTGLDCQAVFILMDELQIVGAKRMEIFRDVQTMEIEVLNFDTERRQQNQ